MATSAELPFSLAQARRLGPIRRWFADHPQASDVLVVLIFLLLTAMELLAYISDLENRWLLLIIGAMAALLAVRRRFPLRVLGGILILTLATIVVVPVPPLMGVTFAVYAVSSQKPPRIAWLSVSVTTAALLIALAVPMLTNTQEWFAAIGVVDLAGTSGASTRWLWFLYVAANNTIFMLVAHSIGLSVRARRQHTQDLVDRANQVALERDQREQLAVAQERSRIAREMHDVVAHSLSVMIALSDGANTSLDRSPEQSRRALSELSDTGRDALREMRRILGVLRTDDFDTGFTPFDGETPLAPTDANLEELTARFRSAGLNVALDANPPPQTRTPSIEMAAYRIVQEALTNVLRHVERPDRVEVEVDYQTDQVAVSVTDVGGRPTHTPGGGNGLVGMRERAATHGGTVEAGPTTDGWRVYATLPWEGRKA
ncbi:MAG: sensor histidine kinase [Beutenbergiaceae bacterium]